MNETDRSEELRPDLERCLNTRRILLFVSSTFRDLQDERDELCMRVFPRIRTFCRERSVTFTEIDLRWGITADQAESQQILSRCFHEIERSQPFFLGIIGERYGWVPSIGEEIPEAFVETHPWLRDHAGRSVTELEFLHGVFNQTRGHEHAWFYSRRSAGHNKQTGTALTSYGHKPDEKLEALKQRLRESEGDFREGFRSPQTLGEWVYKDLTSAIEKLFPDTEINEPQRHANEASRYQTGFAGRLKELKKIEQLQRRSGRCVVIAGEPGAGKTSLLANWYCNNSEPSTSQEPRRGWLHQFRISGPARSRRKQLSVIRFAQLTPDSSTPGLIALSVIRELQERLSLNRALPSDPATALAEFSGWLSEAGQIANIRLVIAKIDMIESDPGRVSILLPCPAPAGVSLIASVSGAAESSDYTICMGKAGWHVLTPGPMSDSDLCLAIERTLANYGKQVAQPDEIIRRMSSHLPSFVRTFLETIRLHGEFGERGEKLEEPINWLLESENEVELYERVMAKWQLDYERDYPGIVTLGFSLVLVTQSGLDETELLDLLGDGARPLPRFAWTPLQAFAERNLCRADGRMYLSAGPFRTALRRTMKIDAATEHELRVQLIDYFRQQPVSIRHADELLWQLAAVEAWNELAEWLANPEHVHQFWPTHEYILKYYYKQLRGRTTVAVTEKLYNNLKTPRVLPNVAITACQLLLDLGARTAVEPLLESMRPRIAESDDVLRRRYVAMLASSMDDRPPESLELLHEEETLCRLTNNRTALAACIGNQATALRRCGRLVEAKERHILEEGMCRELNDLRLLAGSINNQAQIAILEEQYQSAESYLTELDDLARTLRDTRLIGSCQEIRGVCLGQRNKQIAAVQSLQEAADAYREAVDQQALAGCLLRLARTQYLLGDLDSALESLERGINETTDPVLKSKLICESHNLLKQFEV